MKEHGTKLDTYTVELGTIKMEHTVYKVTQLIDMVYKIHDEEVAQGLVDEYRRIQRPKKMEGVHLHEL